MFGQLLRRSRSQSARTSPNRVPSTRVRLGAIELLESRALLSTVAPVPRIINGTAVEEGVARIVNGTPTSGYSSVGIVGDRSGGFCTGTLIASQFVLTAAHCADDLAATAGRFTVAGSTYATSQVFVHPNYNSNRIGADDANDIAIFQLNREVTGVTPDPIFRGTPRVGEVLTLVGFGAGGTGSGHDGTFGNKRVGSTPIDRVTSGLIRWTFDNSSESNTAPGDSGGPAYLNLGGVLYVAGVTSGGSRANAGIGDRSFDTRVDAYASWIDSIVVTATPNPNPDPNEQPDPSPQPISDDHANLPGPAATNIPLSGSGNFNVSGELEESGDRDVFQLAIAERSIVTVDLQSSDSSLDTYLRVFDVAGNLVTQNDDFGGTLNSRVSIVLQSGTYYLSAGSFLDRGVGEYSLTGHVVADDHGDSIALASTITLADDSTGKGIGTIGHAGDQDYFRFVANRTGLFSIDLKATASGIDPVLSVYDSRGRRIAFNDDSGGSLDSRVLVRLRGGMTYFVAAAGFGQSTGDYSADVAFIQATRARGRADRMQSAAISSRSEAPLIVADADRGVRSFSARDVIRPAQYVPARHAAAIERFIASDSHDDDGGRLAAQTAVDAALADSLEAVGQLAA